MRVVRFSNSETMKTNPTTRADLALFVPPGGLLLELGVAAGKLAELLADRNPRMRYLGIDRWSDHHDEAEMWQACERIKKHLTEDAFQLVRSTFADWLPLVPNNYADLIYIDGYAHTGQEGGQTMRDWWPKLKPGGIFAGHDYDREYYPQTFCAVNNFVLEMDQAGIRLYLNVIDEKPHPSWWIVKPEQPPT
jgi:trans-aconitate methyltransferase